MFESASEMLDNAFGLAGDKITYSRQGQSITIAAKLATTGARIQSYDVNFFLRYTDFIVRKSDLGDFFPPEIGDQISYDDMTYYVTAPNNEPNWRFHNRRKPYQVRIHTLLEDKED